MTLSLLYLETFPSRFKELSCEVKYVDFTTKFYSNSKYRIYSNRSRPSIILGSDFRKLLLESF